VFTISFSKWIIAGINFFVFGSFKSSSTSLTGVEAFSSFFAPFLLGGASLDFFGEDPLLSSSLPGDGDAF